MNEIMKAKKLIEVALPIKEISAESVRDKSIRHGHISTLHLWWARRPLPVCRAVVFASLVPDPLDEHCPQAFRDAVAIILGPQTKGVVSVDVYLPYKDIPYTSVEDPMEDNLRNRLMMFIGKFSETCQQNMKDGKSTPPKEQLSDGSLIKWENKNNKKILRMARELIYVAYHAEREPELGYESLHRQFDASFDAIAEAEDALYGVVDRHIEMPEVEKLEENLQQAIEHFQNEMPSVFDPFAGGGAIPLEAARLGCRSFGNDINPVAHIIERGSAEFPQKYGKPIVYSEAEFKKKYGERGLKMAQEKGKDIIRDEDGNYHIPNRLSWDVEYYAKELLEMTEKEVGYLYPADENGNKPIAYYWARTAKCSNPSCGAEVPLLKQFYLANTSKKKVYLNPIIHGTDIQFEIKEGKYDVKVMPGWNNRGNLTCPCCGSVTKVNEIKKQSKDGFLKDRLLAIIEESAYGKKYILPSKEQEAIMLKTPTDIARSPEIMPIHYDQAFPVCTWGYYYWTDLFSKRQLNFLYVLIAQLNKIKSLSSAYQFALLTLLSLWIDRICAANTSAGRWHNGRETLEHPFGRQAISMIFDYPESNPFCQSSGSALNQLEWVLRFLESESPLEFSAKFNHASSGEKNQFEPKSLNAAITDPPYYDAIGYADCSDFFYVWLKKTLGDIYPIDFSTPQTPKTDECTAIKHQHGSVEKAKRHFEHKLTEIFDAIEYQTSDIVSIMFAHQSTEAWTTLCNSILGARMNITGSWPMDTEMANRNVGLSGAALESSVTVACRPSERRGFGEYKEVKRDIEAKVKEEVESLYELGFRGADLLTACFGQAVSEFGRYKTVEKADGSEVSVGELLEMARNAAFDALLAGVQGDDYTKFYVGWLQLNGAGETDYDDATKFTRVGVNVDINEIKYKHLLILDGKKMHIAMAEEHLIHANYGLSPTDSLIDQAHRAILLWREGNRQSILKFIANIAPESSSPLWRLLATLKELLPAGDDLKDVQGLLQNADDLRQNCHKQQVHTEGNLDF